METAVLVIDIINDFVSGALGSERSASIIPNVKRLLDGLRKKGVPVIYLTDAHLPGIDPEFELWPRHGEQGTEGAEILDEIRPVKGDFHLHKRSYSCFYGTGLDALLRDLEVKTLILTGLVTNICIQHTAADAFFRGYRILVPRDCVSSLSDEAQESSLKIMKEIYGAEITDSCSIMEKVSQGGV
jgi:nicotinamidase-related amidase